MDETIIQQAIEHWNKQAATAKNPEFKAACELFATYLESLLPKEKEFVGKVWDAAIKYEEVKVAGERGLLSIVNHNPAPDKHQFINQLYSKQ